ncbi:MAG: alkaline phosphatase family protein [Acidithiobacillus sp.]
MITSKTTGSCQNIRSIVFIYQESHSFDHYFGAYQHPRGITAANLFRPDGKITTH